MIRRITLILIFCFITLTCFAQTRYLYLAQWEWYIKNPNFSYWRCPGGDCLGLVDLRTIPQMSKAGGIPEGYGFFVYDRELTGPSAIFLGNDLNEPLKNKELVVSALKIDSLSANTPLDVLWEMLTTKSDPTGQTAPKPLRGKLGEEVKVYLAGKIVKSEPFNEAHKQRTIAVFHADYKRNKADGVPLEALNRWTGSEMKKLYGEMSDEISRKLLSAEYAGDGWKIPHTTIGDTFVEASDTALNLHTATGPNGGFSWTHVAGSFTVKEATDDVDSSGVEHNNARAENALSNDDMYAQANIWLPDTAGRDIGLITRFAVGTNTGYLGLYDTTSDLYHIYRLVNGEYTSLATASQAGMGFTGELLYLESDSSNQHTLKLDDVQKVTVSDTIITGNFYSGLRSYQASSTFDNFQAGDLGAGVTRRIWTF